MGDKDPKSIAKGKRSKQEKKNGGSSTTAVIETPTQERVAKRPGVHQKKGIPPDALQKGDNQIIKQIMKNNPRFSRKQAIEDLRETRRRESGQ